MKAVTRPIVLVLLLVSLSVVPVSAYMQGVWDDFELQNITVYNPSTGVGSRYANWTAAGANGYLGSPWVGGAPWYLRGAQINLPNTTIKQRGAFDYYLSIITGPATSPGRMNASVVVNVTSALQGNYSNKKVVWTQRFYNLSLWQNGNYTSGVGLPLENAYVMEFHAYYGNATCQIGAVKNNSFCFTCGNQSIPHLEFATGATPSTPNNKSLGLVEGAMYTLAIYINYGTQTTNGQCRYIVNGNFTDGVTASVQTVDSGWVFGGGTNMPNENNMLFTKYISSTNAGLGFLTAIDSVNISGPTHPCPGITPSCNLTNFTNPNITFTPSRWVKFGSGASGLIPYGRTGAPDDTWTGIVNRTSLYFENTTGYVFWSEPSVTTVNVKDCNLDGITVTPGTITFDSRLMSALCYSTPQVYNMSIYGNYSLWTNPYILRNGTTCGANCFSQTFNGSGAYFRTGIYTPVVYTYTVANGSSNITYTKYNGATSNFSSKGVWSQPVLENTSYGKIAWTGSNLVFSNANFDAYVVMSTNFLSVTHTSLPANVNTPANVTIYGNYASMVYPLLLKDGVDCAAACTNKVFNSTGAYFSVTNFSNFTVVDTWSNVSFSKFNGATTNFSSIAGGRYTTPILENTTYGRIRWNGANLNFTGANFDAYVTISANFLGVQSASLPVAVNTSANVTLYGDYSTWTLPKIMKDGVECVDCTLFAYNTSGAYFNVSGFSNYTLENGTVVQSGVLNLTSCGLVLNNSQDLRIEVQNNITFGGPEPNTICVQLTGGVHKNVTLDCNNYVVTGDDDSFALVFSVEGMVSASNISFEDCKIIDAQGKTSVATFNGVTGTMRLSRIIADDLGTFDGGASTGGALYVSGESLVIEDSSMTSGYGYIDTGSGMSSIIIRNTNWTIASGFSSNMRTSVLELYGNKFVVDDTYFIWNQYMPTSALIYNNIFNFTAGGTLWQLGGVPTVNLNTTANPGTNIIGGSTIGGNYWINNTGGYSETCVGDGTFCTTPYDIFGDASAYDYLPLTNNAIPNPPSDPTIAAPVPETCTQSRMDEWNSCGSIGDNHWENSNGPYLYFNYTKPDAAIGAISEYAVATTGQQNATVPQSCWNAIPGKVLFRADGGQTGMPVVSTYWECNNGTGWQVINGTLGQWPLHGANPLGGAGPYYREEDDGSFGTFVCQFNGFASKFYGAYWSPPYYYCSGSGGGQLDPYGRFYEDVMHWQTLEHKQPFLVEWSDNNTGVTYEFEVAGPDNNFVNATSYATQLNATAYEFNATAFGVEGWLSFRVRATDAYSQSSNWTYYDNYSLYVVRNVTDCKNLTFGGGYWQQGNVAGNVPTGFCIDVQGDNIMFDGQDFTLNNTGNTIGVHNSSWAWVKNSVFNSNGWIGLNDSGVVRLTRINASHQNGELMGTGSGQTGVVQDLTIENSTYVGSGTWIGWSLGGSGVWYLREFKHNSFTSSYPSVWNVPPLQYSLYVTSVYNNLLYGNAANPMWSGAQPTYLNTTRQPGKPIVGNKTEIGGNYWRYYDGSGYSETCADANQDGFCDTPPTWGDALPLTLSTPPQITGIVCSSADPVEKDLPAPANMQVNFTIYDTQGFNASSTWQNLSYGSLVVNGTCGYVQSDATHRNYSCNNTMHYWYTAGLYVAKVAYTNAVYSVNATGPLTCGYSALISFKYIPNELNFPTASPGVLNAQSNVPLVLTNEGNVARNVSIIAHDLHGVSSPGNKIPATAFKAGVALGSAVTMADGIQKDLNITVLPGQTIEIWLWLSMPGTTVIQSYVTTAPWQLINS